MATYLQDNWFDFQLDFDSKPLPMGKWVRSRQCHWKNCLAFRFHVPSLKEAARTWKWMVERWNFLLFGMASYFQVRTVGCRVYIFLLYTYASYKLHASTSPSDIRANQNAGTPSFSQPPLRKTTHKKVVCRWVFGWDHRFTPFRKKGRTLESPSISSTWNGECKASLW